MSQITQEVRKPDPDLGPCVSRILLIGVPVWLALYGNKVDVSLGGNAGIKQSV